MKRLLILLAILLALLPATLVFAIADPLTPPTVNAVYVYNLADGGMGVLVDYYLDYVSPYPTETATESFLAVFIDIDGTTQLKSVAPYTFQASGYKRGLIWIPFTAAEVTTYSIDNANLALYRVWLVGNPTLAWAGVPPKTVSLVNEWSTIADPSVLIALRILYYADLLELAWSLNMIESTSLGNRLTTLGASYFESVIPGLRTIAPACFSSSTMTPPLEDVDYSTAFGAIATSTVLGGSPVTLIEGANALNPTGAGTIVFTLQGGTIGTVVGAVVATSPVSIVAGNNTVTITGAGAITATVNLRNTATILEGLTLSTGFDLTPLATEFGMSRWMLSGLIWMLLAVVACAKATGISSKRGYDSGTAGGKVILPVLFFWTIAGTLLGLLHPLVAALMFILLVGLSVAYVLFFRGANV